LSKGQFHAGGVTLTIIFTVFTILNYSQNEIRPQKKREALLIVLEVVESSLACRV